LRRLGLFGVSLPAIFDPTRRRHSVGSPCRTALSDEACDGRHYQKEH
jgi:hypothetical protein